MIQEFEGITRRLPVYLLLDRSGSMTGEPIEAVRQGVKYLVTELSNDPHALETAFLSVISFGSDAKQDMPLIDVSNFKEPKLDANGTTSLGEALRILDRCLETEVRKSAPNQKGDYKPLVFIMTDGEPTDNWESAADVIKQKNGKFANIIAVGCGSHVNSNTLKKLTEIVLMMNSVKPGDFEQFFRWVSQSIKLASVKLGEEKPVDLPAPPSVIQLIP